MPSKLFLSVNFYRKNTKITRAWWGSQYVLNIWLFHNFNACCISRLNLQSEKEKEKEKKRGKQILCLLFSYAKQNILSQRVISVEVTVISKLDQSQPSIYLKRGFRSYYYIIAKTTLLYECPTKKFCTMKKQMFFL